jgi:hypothetical protein
MKKSSRRFRGLRRFRRFNFSQIFSLADDIDFISRRLARRSFSKGGVSPP